MGCGLALALIGGLRDLIRRHSGSGYPVTGVWMKRFAPFKDVQKLITRQLQPVGARIPKISLILHGVFGICLATQPSTSYSTPLSLAQDAVVLNSMIPDSIAASLSLLLDQSNLSGNSNFQITAVQNRSDWTSALTIGSFSGLQASATVNGSITSTTAGDDGGWSIGGTVGPSLISGNGTANFQEVDGSGRVQVAFHNVLNVGDAAAAIDAVVIGQESDNLIRFVDTPRGEIAIREGISGILEYSFNPSPLPILHDIEFTDDLIVLGSRVLSSNGSCDKNDGGYDCEGTITVAAAMVAEPPSMSLLIVPLILLAVFMALPGHLRTDVASNLGSRSLYRMN
jgi:hypothetical protein